MKERWRPVAGYEQVYMVSDLGRVYGRVSRVMLKSWANNQGRLLVELSGKPNPSGARSVRRLVHRMVLEAFEGPCPPGHEGMHGPGGPRDNRLINLRWGTAKMNQADRLGRLPGFWNGWTPPEF